MPVHDALLIESPIEEIEDQVIKTQQIMAEASLQVLGGFALRTDAKIFTDRFMDERGESTWNLVKTLLNQCGPTQLQDRLFDQKGNETNLPACGLAS